MIHKPHIIPYIGIGMLILACGVVGSPGLYADTIILNNGHVLEGYIFAERNNKVQIETFLGNVTVQKSRIREIKRSSHERNTLLKAEMFVQDEEWYPALQRYSSLLENDATTRSLIVDSVLKYKQNILDAVPGMNPALRVEIKNITKQLAAGESNNNELQFFKGQIYFALGDRSEAFKILVDLPPKFLAADNTRRQFVKDILRKNINETLEQHKFAETLQKIETISCIDKSMGTTFEIVLYLRWGRTLRDEKNFDAALEIYNNKLYPLAPAIASNRIKQTLNEIIEHSKATRAYQEAIDLVTRYARERFPDFYEDTIGGLAVEYSTWLMNDGQYDTANYILKTYYEVMEQEVAGTLINRNKYKEKASMIESGDYQAHYELGKFCVERQLFDEAIEEFEKAAESSTFKENAELQVRLIKEKQERKMFREAMRLHSNKKYTQALDLLQKTRDKFPDGALLSNIVKLERLCEDGLKDEAWRRPYQAQAYYQQAERLFYLGDHTNALKKIESVLSLYPKTPAADEALHLKERIATTIRLARLEGNPLDINTQKVDIETSPSRTQQLETEIETILDALK